MNPDNNQTLPTLSDQIMSTDNSLSMVELNIVFYDPVEQNRKLDIHFALDKNNISFADYVSCIKKAALVYGFSPAEVNTISNIPADIEPSYMNNIPLTE